MMKSRFTSIKKVLTAMIILLIGGSYAYAAQQEQQFESTHLSKEELSEILKSGDVLSLEAVIEKINKDKNDRMLEVELLNYDDVLIYQIEILKTNGVVVTYYLDAKTGEDASRLLED
ncbi:MAG: PepSY domain-containing protein [Kordiimonadaceae bacterium]|jgi:uncharacterized membrane protein YkoI|nr:PepSY domain-containing protein [Kordiimonadaceae bacterium]MBT6037501.1 PepSY domain-containing protein [Kordiimonadaceae bacterium]MBT6328141.1 PepSY domain-containing protein [Kordiimonadaceae bacterium]MBT7581541.1 PepSY domain-containing protein [Kordiimonadaceae bacterium]